MKSTISKEYLSDEIGQLFIDEYNILVAAHNELCKSHDDLAKAHDELVEQFKEISSLVDRLVDVVFESGGELDS